MAVERLKVLLTVRQLTVEQARQALAMCMKVEAEVSARIAVIDFDMQRNRAINKAAEHTHPFLQMFAQRLENMQTWRKQEAAALAVAESRSADARACVTEARIAAEAVQALIEERSVAAAAEISRRSQHMMDDIARTQFVAAASHR